MGLIKKKRSGAGSPCVYGAVWNAKFQQRRVVLETNLERAIVPVLFFSGMFRDFCRVYGFNLSLLFSRFSIFDINYKLRVVKGL